MFFSAVLIVCACINFNGVTRATASISPTSITTVPSASSLLPSSSSSSSSSPNTQHSPPATGVPPIATVDARLSSPDNVTCLTFKGQIAVYVRLVNNAGGNSQHFINIPQDNVSITGDCSLNATEQTLMFSDPVGKWNLQFTFTENVAEGSVSISNTTFTFKSDSSSSKLAVTSPTFQDSQKDLLQSKVSGYFLCSSNTTLVNQDNFKVTVANLRYSVYSQDVHSEDVGGSGCRADLIISTTAPLATGLALVGLYACVISGYLLLSRHFDIDGFKGTKGSKSYNLGD